MFKPVYLYLYLYLYFYHQFSVSQNVFFLLDSLYYPNPRIHQIIISGDTYYDLLCVNGYQTGLHIGITWGILQLTHAHHKTYQHHTYPI